MVYEECDEEVVEPAPTEPVKRTSSLPKPAPKSTKSKDTGKGQKSMMSFFSKK